MAGDRLRASPQIPGDGCTGALQFALTYQARTLLLAGDLAAAARLIEEGRLIAEATGNPCIEYSAMLLAAWRGDEKEASALIETALADAAARGQQDPCLGITATFVACASAVLYNGLGRHDAACAAVRHLLPSDPSSFELYAPLIMPELGEAAYWSGDGGLVRDVHAWLSQRASVTRTNWAQGMAARARVPRRGRGSRGRVSRIRRAAARNPAPGRAGPLCTTSWRVAAP
jgi:hypothetical protein